MSENKKLSASLLSITFAATELFREHLLVRLRKRQSTANLEQLRGEEPKQTHRSSGNRKGKWQLVTARVVELKRFMRC